MKKLEIVTSKDDMEEKKELKIEYSLYKASYLEVIKIFLNNCEKIEESDRKTEENVRSFDYQRYPQNMDNVISIVGRRGSGKTTAMQEIRNIFLNFNEKKKNWITKMGKQYAEEFKKQIDKNFAFSIMDVVDASVLEEKDDLLEIILWFMCREVSEKIRKDKYNNRYIDSEYERQKFIDALDEVYKMHQSVKGKNEEKYSGESVVTALESMPNSIRTRLAMENLLEIYCKILFPHEYPNAYLVVAIDDLDLNIQKGYQMLEEIRRYLLNWRIIVLLAVDYKQMENVCETYFFKEFGIKRYDIIDKGLEGHIGELRNSYMTKVFPFSNRIYLVEQNLKRAKIKDEDKEYSIKGYLLFKIAKKMNIFYDPHGLKTHFCEPNNVRELVNYVQFLDALNTIDWEVPEGEDKEEYYKKQLLYYDQNHEKFNQDIVDRMAFQILKSKQREPFNELLKRDLERRTGYVLQCYENSIHEKDILKEIMEKYDFTYGDFLGCIYHWGRKNYEYKPLIHCFLASFTSEMTREYINYRFSDKEESRNHSKKRLENYVGDGIGGGWLCEGLGKVHLKDKEVLMKINKNEIEMEKEEETYIEWVAYGKARDLEAIKFNFNIEKRDAETAEERFIQILNSYCEKKILPILECIFMCIEIHKFGGDERTCIPKVEVRNTTITKELEINNEYSFTVEIINDESADIDILGFIKKSIDYCKWKQDVGNVIQDKLVKFAKEAAGYNGTEVKNVDIDAAVLKLKKTSMFAKENSEYEMALPLYNLDLSYNILKRVRRNCVQEFAKPCFHEDVIDRVDKIYNYIANELKEDESEFEKIDKNLKFTYRKNFDNDPYIKKFKELIKNGDSKKFFSEQFQKMYTKMKFTKIVQPEREIGIDLEND